MGRLGPSKSLFQSGLIHSELQRIAATAWRNAVLDEASPDDISRNTESLSESFLGEPANIEASNLSTVEVKSIRSSWHDGNVFNFETTTGWFGSHGLIIHNCRCSAEPNFKEVLNNL